MSLRLCLGSHPSFSMINYLQELLAEFFLMLSSSEQCAVPFTVLPCPSVLFIKIVKAKLIDFF